MKESAHSDARIVKNHPGFTWITFLSNVVTLALHRYVVIKYVALTPHPATCLIR
jgi:hypothetical protein